MVAFLVVCIKGTKHLASILMRTNFAIGLLFFRFAEMAAAFFAVMLLFCVYFEETLSVGCSGSAIDGERRQLLQILDPLKAYGFIIQDQHSVNEYTVHLCNNPFSQVKAKTTSINFSYLMFSCNQIIHKILF